MEYRLGTSGLGHWVRRLQTTLEDRGGEIDLFKAVGTRTYEARRDELGRYGIPRQRYYMTKPGEPLPADFYEGLDIVYVASPNEFHKEQTLNALEMGKVTVTEKTFAVNRREFAEVVSVIKRNGQERRVALGLHYLSKALTQTMGRMLPSLVRDFGRVTSVSATFFEEKRAEDAGRAWLFRPENGGIAMDWIHPISIVSYTMKAERMKLEEVRPFIAMKEYDDTNPSAFEARYAVFGEHFQEGAMAVIRVGKGLSLAHKVMRIVFERGTADLNYISTDQEFTSGARGEMLITPRGGEPRIVRPAGPLSYEPMLDDMLNLVKGGSASMSIEDISHTFDPEWQLQEGMASVTPSNAGAEIERFFRSGLSHSTD